MLGGKKQPLNFVDQKLKFCKVSELTGISPRDQYEIKPERHDIDTKLKDEPGAVTRGIMRSPLYSKVRSIQEVPKRSIVFPLLFNFCTCKGAILKHRFGQRSAFPCVSTALKE